MSNQVFANMNKVENVKSGSVHYLIEIVDSYNYGSVNIEEEQITMGDIELLQHLKDYGSDTDANISDLIDSLFEAQKGLTINDTWYDWDEIKQVFKAIPGK